LFSTSLAISSGWGQETFVARNDAIDLRTIGEIQPEAIILSPGPCSPNEAGCSLAIVEQFHAKIPILGVCLGHQAIGQAFGGRVIRAYEPMHGRTSQVFHEDAPLFADVPNPLTACRYHSLIVERASLPSCLEITAWTSDGAIMAFAHREYPVVGVQFHPESILTDTGYVLLANFLKLSGIALPDSVPGIFKERDEPQVLDRVLPVHPVTF
jgi:anthranilate synthase/aminodeoxychorismate synthase-like glutamine amidotransferase